MRLCLVFFHTMTFPFSIVLRTTVGRSAHTHPLHRHTTHGHAHIAAHHVSAWHAKEVGIEVTSSPTRIAATPTSVAPTSSSSSSSSVRSSAATSAVSTCPWPTSPAHHPHHHWVHHAHPLWPAIVVPTHPDGRACHWRPVMTSSAHAHSSAPSSTHTTHSSCTSSLSPLVLGQRILRKRPEGIAICAGRQGHICAPELEIVLFKPCLDLSGIRFAVCLHVCHSLGLSVDFVLGEGDVLEAELDADNSSNLADLFVGSPPVEISNVDGVLDVGVGNLGASC